MARREAPLCPSQCPLRVGGCGAIGAETLAGGRDDDTRSVGHSAHAAGFACKVAAMIARGGVLVIGAVCLASCAPIAPPRPPPTPQGVFQPAPGYRFAALPEPGANVLWLDIRYPVGFVDDPPGKPGLAHLVEHLLFGVEIDRDGHKTSIEAELRRITLSFNADTREDLTTYHATLPPEHLDEVLRLERERLAVGCAGLTPELFARERAVVIRELQTTSTPDERKIEQLVREVAYPHGHPYRPVDSVESVAKLELADACRFLDGPYRRGEVIVVATGGVDRERLARAAHAFDHAPAREALTRPSLAVASLYPGTSRHDLRLARPQLIALWTLPPSDTRAYRMMMMVRWALADIINNNHPGYDAWVSTVGGDHAPILALHLTLRADSEWSAATDAVREMVDRLTYNLGNLEAKSALWQDVQRMSTVDVLSTWDVLARRSQEFAAYLDAGHGSDYLADRLSEIKTTVPAQAVVPVRMALSNTRFLVLQAAGAQAHTDAEEEAAVLEQVARSATDRAAELADFHEVRIDPATADRPLAIPPAPPEHHAEVVRLANGLTAVLWPYGSTPLVRGALVVHAGWVDDPLGQEGLAQVLGEQSGAIVTPDHILFRASPRPTSDAAPLIRELVTPLHDGLQIDVDSKQRLRKRLAEARARGLIDHLLRMAMYGRKHAYARSEMTEHTLAMINSDGMNAWAARHLSPSNATLILTGQFDVKKIKLQLTASFESPTSRGHADAPSVLDEPHPTQAWIPIPVEAEMRNLVLEVSFVGGRGIDKDHAKRLVLEEVLAKKLFELRERTALAYTPEASYTPCRGGGLWSVRANVDRERAAEAGAALGTLLAQMRGDPEAYRVAFVVARQKVMERMLAIEGGSADALNRLANAARFELDAGRPSRLVADVAALTLANFHSFVTHELAATGQVFTVLGNSAAVDAAIDAAKQATTAP